MATFIFDLDGTLANTIPIIRRVAKITSEQYLSLIHIFHLCADELRKYDMCGIMHNVRKKKSHREAVDYEYKYYLDCRG